MEAESFSGASSLHESPTSLLRLKLADFGLACSYEPGGAPFWEEVDADRQIVTVRAASAATFKRSGA